MMNNTAVTIDLRIPNKLLFRPDEVAIIFDVSVPTIYNWKNNGTLPCIKGIGPIRFRREDIVKILMERD